MNTYRERLQALIDTLQECYDEAGVLRDYSHSNLMTEPFNKIRSALPSIWGHLQTLDNAIPDDVAAMRTKGRGLVKESQ